MIFHCKVKAIIHSMRELPVFIKELIPIVALVVSYIAAGYIVQYGFGIENMMSLRLNYNLLNILTICRLFARRTFLEHIC